MGKLAKKISDVWRNLKMGTKLDFFSKWI